MSIMKFHALDTERRQICTSSWYENEVENEEDTI